MFQQVERTTSVMVKSITEDDILISESCSKIKPTRGVSVLRSPQSPYFSNGLTNNATDKMEMKGSV